MALRLYNETGGYAGVDTPDITDKVPQNMIPEVTGGPTGNRETTADGPVDCGPGTHPVIDVASGPKGRCEPDKTSADVSGGASLDSGQFKSGSTSYKFSPIDYSKFMNPDWTQNNQIRDWWLKSPEYQQALRQVGSIYNSFGLKGAGAYGQSVDYWSSIMGGNKAAMAKYLGPTYSALGDQTKQLGKTIANNASLRGGAREAAMRDLGTESFRQSQGLIQSAQPQAAQQLGQLGVQGGQLGEQAAATYGSMVAAPFQTALDAEFKNRSLGATLAMANQSTQLGYNQLNASLIMKADELALNKYATDAGLAFNYASLGQSASQFAQSFGLQQQQQDWMQNTYYPMQLQMYQQQLAQQKQASNASKWGSILGSALRLGTSTIPGGSIFGRMFGVGA